MQSSRSKTISGLSATTEEDAARDAARRQEGRMTGRRSEASIGKEKEEKVIEPMMFHNPILECLLHRVSLLATAVS